MTTSGPKDLFRGDAPRIHQLPLALAFVLTTAATASAQHTNAVLFGEGDAAGLALSAERRAVHPLTAPHYN